MKNYFYWGILFVIFIAIVNKCNKTDENPEDERKKDIYKRHCSFQWDKESDSSKEIILNEFISEGGNVDSNNIGNEFSLISKKFLSIYLKYPETMQKNGEPWNGWVYISDDNSKISNVKKGHIEIFESFSAENKMSIRIKSTLYVKIKYTAGCKRFEVLDAKVY